MHNLLINDHAMMTAINAREILKSMKNMTTDTTTFTGATARPWGWHLVM